MPPDNTQFSGTNFSSISQITSITYQGCPDLLLLHSKNVERYPFLLQSTSENNKNSRFDILFAFPQKSLILNSDFKLYLDNKLCPKNNFLNLLDEQWLEDKTTVIENKSGLPFTGGWFIYLAYELLGQIEEKVKVHKVAPEMDIAVAMRIPAAIICDNKKNVTYIITEIKFKELLPELIADYNNIDSKSFNDNENFQLKKIKEESPEYFIERINKVKKYIYEGDVFQSNLSREWSVTEAENIKSTTLYNKLRQKNPASFSGIAKFNNVTVISSSPERLIKVKDNIVETRPIAGTIRRSSNKAEDIELANNLLNDPKEKSEHVMLVDMERNDLGKICKTGTIFVNEMMVLESLQHVHHIVSNIKGLLKNDVTPGDIIKAVFPGGSITGCPKVRCMEIIHELENTARNSYTGSMGYLDNNGNMDLNILIRTIEKTSSKLTFKMGAGIVNDSEINQELQETRNKAKGLLEAML
jgi:anthranilate synthase component 1